MSECFNQWLPQREPWLELAPSKPPTINAYLEDDASDDDRLWFEDNPGRNYRLRPRKSGELGDESHEHTTVLVAQYAPGVRLRRLVRTVGPLPVDHDEQFERLAWFIDRGEPACVLPDGRVMGLDELPMEHPDRARH